MLTKIKFENFTAFQRLEIPFSSGINVFIGENGTGKTHILKAAYSTCVITKNHGSLAESVNENFLPLQTEHLIKQNLQKQQTNHKSPLRMESLIKQKGEYKVFRKIQDGSEIYLGVQFFNNETVPTKKCVKGNSKKWLEEKIESVYIPVKDMLAHAPGFRSLVTERKVHFEKIYIDIIDKAFLPMLKIPIDKQRRLLLEKLQKVMGGEIETKGENFFLRNKHGNLEFTLLAEGFRKLGLLWLLIQNGTLKKGSILFWDEPEANLNPKMMEIITHILLELQQLGVQIFIATHDYALLEEFDLQLKPENQILFHSLFHSESGEIKVASTKKYEDISPNAIDEAFGSMIDRDIQKHWKGKKQ
ncbi:MAG: AAA family ATPase [Planctomycetaceae bacterium]|jgi:AAA15 family ATPase/GTPase|nr:AAA family ATPase [Planctomycetaceae bacterium]